MLKSTSHANRSLLHPVPTSGITSAFGQYLTITNLGRNSCAQIVERSPIWRLTLKTQRVAIGKMRMVRSQVLRWAQAMILMM